MGAEGLVHGPDGDVERNRLVPAGGHHGHTVLPGGPIVGLDHPADEPRLAAQVEVVGSLADAGGDQTVGPAGVGPGQVDHDAGPGGEVVDPGGIIERRDDQVRAAAVEPGGDVVEARPVPAGDGPRPVRADPLRQVGGDNPAGPARRPVHDEIRAGHRRGLSLSALWRQGA